MVRCDEEEREVEEGDNGTAGALHCGVLLSFPEPESLSGFMGGKSQHKSYKAGFTKGLPSLSPYPPI